MTDTVTLQRRLLIPAATTFVIVAALLALGAWQLQRKAEKQSLIAALSQRLAAAPAPLPPSSRWSELTPAADEFRRVVATGDFIDGEAKVFAAPTPLRKDISGNGAWAFAPLRIASGEAVVVNRGFVAEGQVAAPPISPATITGYLRFPETPTWLTPAADRAKALWFIRDHVAIARAFGWGGSGGVAPFYIDVEGPAPSGGVPKPGPLTVALKDDHLQYAITWFSLALAVVIAFCVWLRSEFRAGAGSTPSL